MKRTSMLLMVLISFAMINCEKSDPVCTLPSPDFMVNGQLAGDETIVVDILNNGNLNLSTVSAEGYTYHWTGPNGFESDSPIAVIPAATEANSGVYSVTMSKGICNGTSSVSVDVNGITPPPCTVQNNKLIFSGPISLTPITFYGMTDSANSGEFELTANGTGGDLYITFYSEEAPQTGIYEISTECPTSFLDAGQVCMAMNYNGYYAVADSGSVYITLLENGNYVVNFCDVLFNSSYPFELIGSAQITQD